MGQLVHGEVLGGLPAMRKLFCKVEDLEYFRAERLSFVHAGCVSPFVLGCPNYANSADRAGQTSLRIFVLCAERLTRSPARGYDGASGVREDGESPSLPRNCKRLEFDNLFEATGAKALGRLSELVET
jgi:hypothetical protein